jgi:hypothetical protein
MMVATYEQILQKIVMVDRMRPAQVKEGLGRIGEGFSGTPSPASLARMFYSSLGMINWPQDWDFVDFGADYGRLMVVAAVLGAKRCAGVEISKGSQLNYLSFKQKMSNYFAQTHNPELRLQYRDANSVKDLRELLPPCVDEETRPTIAGLADQGIPMDGTRQHTYHVLGQDPRVQIIFSGTFADSSSRELQTLLHHEYGFQQVYKTRIAIGKTQMQGRVFLRTVPRREGRCSAVSSHATCMDDDDELLQTLGKRCTRSGHSAAAAGIKLLSMLGRAPSN